MKIRNNGLNAVKKIVSCALLFCLIFSVCACNPRYSVTFKVNDKIEKVMYSDREGNVQEHYPDRIYGYRFVGWYTDDGEKLDFSAPLTHSITVKAKFIELSSDTETYSVVYMETDVIDADYKIYGDTGEVTLVATSEHGYYVQARGYYGYDTTQNPYMEAGVFVAKDGIIKYVEKIGEYNQSQGFSDFITQDYLDSAYSDTPAATDFVLIPATGATLTSTAVQYAVYTAAYYLENVYGVKANTAEETKAEFNALYPAEYSSVETDYEVNSNIGAVIYAAEGSSESGNVLALKIKSSRKVVANGACYQGWDSQIPYSYTMLIIIDAATNKIAAYSIITDGTRETEYFTVPDELLETYKSVEIASQNVFDNYDAGLDRPNYSVEQYYADSAYVGKVITGTSLLFTGATTNGTFSSQLVRNCFRAAAYFYCNYR